MFVKVQGKKQSNTLLITIPNEIIKNKEIFKGEYVKIKETNTGFKVIVPEFINKEEEAENEF